MTAAGWGLVAAGGVAFAWLCLRCPATERGAMRLTAFVLISIVGGAIIIAFSAKPQKPPRASALAPIAGAPLVRVIDVSWPRVADAHALVAEPAARRLRLSVTPDVEVLP